MKILIHKDKHGDVYYDISTLAKELAVLVYMFDDFKERGYYSNETGSETTVSWPAGYNRTQIKRYEDMTPDLKAKCVVARGEAGYEYEEFETEEVIDITD